MFNLREFLNLTYYTSPLDQFLAEYDKNHPKLSASQRKEVEKYRRIFNLRDIPSPAQEKDSIWDKF